jgi:hypothetical protein
VASVATTATATALVRIRIVLPVISGKPPRLIAQPYWREGDHRDIPAMTCGRLAIKA